MKIVATAIPGVVIVQSQVHDDSRGFFTEFFRADNFRALGLPDHFVQDNHSRSTQYVLRGLHFQRNHPQGKLIRAVNGSIYDVAVDFRRSSPTFRQWVGITLSAGDGQQLYIPPGFGHGYFSLTPVTDIVYKCTTLYDRTSDSVVRFDDPDLAITWPLPPGVAPLVSDRDRVAPLLADAALFD